MCDSAAVVVPLKDGEDWLSFYDVVAKLVESKNGNNFLMRGAKVKMPFPLRFRNGKEKEFYMCFKGGNDPHSFTFFYFIDGNDDKRNYFPFNGERGINLKEDFRR